MNNSNFKNNIIVHNIVADKYMSDHKEIYNSVEQLRLFTNLKKYLNLINKENKDIVTLDYGAGDGNLTNHLLNLNCEVIAADVSPKFIERLNRKYYNKKYQREGDIHVWEDDHIDWQLIEQKVLNRFEVVTYEEYLLFIEGYDEEIYNQHKKMFNDVGYLVLKKI